MVDANRTAEARLDHRTSQCSVEYNFDSHYLKRHYPQTILLSVLTTISTQSWK